MYPIVSSYAHIHLQTWLYFKVFLTWWSLGIIHDWIWFDQTIEYGLFSYHQFNIFIFPLFSSTITVSLEFSFECLTYSNLFWVFELQFFRLLLINLSESLNWISFYSITIFLSSVEGIGSSLISFSISIVLRYDPLYFDKCEIIMWSVVELYWKLVNLLL